MQNILEKIKKFWRFLNEDTWQSWALSLILIFLCFKFILFPFLTLVTGAPLPLVVVESCSMYHETNFNNWWNNNAEFYKNEDISKSNFEQFPYKNGINKGDIIFVWNRGEIKKGDIIIFDSNQKYPIIHRTISLDPLATKGDHNARSFSELGEDNIPENKVLGKATFRIPLVGWLKLIFFEFTRNPTQRGFCN